MTAKTATAMAMPIKSVLDSGIAIKKAEAKISNFEVQESIFRQLISLH
jgi:hypothetical protein